MRMTKSRELLAYVLQIIISVCTVIFIFSSVMHFVLANPDYFSSHFVTGQLVEECNAQLTQKYEVLSKESKIPLRVFEMIKTHSPTDEVLSVNAQRVFSPEENNMLAGENEEYFYTIFKEYAEGNDIKFTKADLKNTAKIAAEIYEETVGIYNADGVYESIVNLRSTMNFVSLISLLLGLICAIAVILMYKHRRNGYYHCLGGLSGGAVATLVMSVVYRLFSPISKFGIEPDVYRVCIERIGDRLVTVCGAVSVALIAACFVTMLLIERKHDASKDKVEITK